MTEPRDGSGGSRRRAFGWFIVALTLAILGALHSSHVATDPAAALTSSIAPATMFSPVGGELSASQVASTTHDRGHSRSLPSVGACLLLLATAVGGILILAVVRFLGITQVPGTTTGVARRPRRTSVSLAQLCIRRT